MQRALPEFLRASYGNPLNLIDNERVVFVTASVQKHLRPTATGLDDDI